MNFEDLQKAWQSQNAGAKVTINADLLMKEVRRNQRRFRATIFWRDVREVGVAFWLTWYFTRRGLRTDAWTDCLVGLACFGVGAFMVVDRLLQRRKQAVANTSLVSCLETSLHQVNHQIWLLKNIFWWYLLPLSAALGVSVAVSGWQTRQHTSQLAGWCVYVVICTLLNWFIYWLNQAAVKKSLTPRKHELETLLAETGNPVDQPEIKNKTMKTTILLTLLLVAVLAVGVILAAVPSATIDSLTPGTPNQPLASILKKHDLPALAVVVVKDGKICDREAVGVRKWGDPTPVTTNDVFHIGSCTKSMTATLTAILIQDGKLRWDTTIAEVFPELKGKMNKQYEAVTVEQLLHHRGGVPADPPPVAWKRAWEQNGTPTQQRREFIAAVLAQPPAVAPGTRMIYSNQGYAIIGAMLEKITGQDYETLITEKLFKPLHMDTAGFGPPGTTGQVDQPWGHIHKLFMTIPVQADNPPAIASAGRVHCSLDDLARFVMLHLQTTTNGLLKPETLARLHALPAGVKSDDPDENYACGWVVLQRDWAGGTALTHTGSNTMWYVVMWLAPEKNFAVIAATNIAGTDAQQGCDEAATLMIQKWLSQ
jgi:CubicO group peptidase (beta-lactamase class C family)